MIQLSYLTTSPIDIEANVPEQWREYVSQEQDASMYRVTIKIQPDDSSYRYRALMQKPQLVLKFSLPFYFEFPVGTQCLWQNQRFFITRAQDVRKQGSRNIEYTMTLYTSEYFFDVWKLRNMVPAVRDESGNDIAPKDNRLKFSLCVKPHEYVDLIVRNLNSKDSDMTWERGECIEASEKTVEFNHTYIGSALADIANAFETEYEVEYFGTSRAKLHLRKVEYFKTEPIALSYGIGNGFIPGVGRTSESDGVPVKRMFVQGSETNIDRSQYGAPELLLPKSQTIGFDGVHFDNEDGYNASIAHIYSSDADGASVERTDVVSTALKEDSLDCSEIYPSRVGTVSEVTVVDADKNFYDFTDTSIPEALDFCKYIIKGETLSIIFQDGMLGGKEFEVIYRHKDDDGNLIRKFEIKPQEIDGQVMPNSIFCPKAQQKYAVFGIQLPKEYICNDATKSGASWDMMRAAVKSLYENETQRFTFSGTLQALWAKRNWLAVSGKLVMGGHVLFSDAQFAPDGTVIRIVGIKDFLTQPYSPQIELSNSVTTASSVSSALREIENKDVTIDDTEKRILSYTKRRFRDAQETIQMLEDAQLDRFTNGISPITVQTMSMLVGDESLQFDFFTLNRGTFRPASCPAVWSEEKKQLICNMERHIPNGASTTTVVTYLRHLTLGHSGITSQSGKDRNGYKTWRIASYTSPVLTDASKKFYLYAKCPHDTEQTGEYVLSETSIQMNADADAYHFLVGILNSEYDGVRSFVSLYGYTEILPGRITTDVITSQDGESYFNIKENAFKLSDKLSFNEDGDGVLRLNGALVQSASGDEFNVPCFRGAYNANTYYYKGDCVTYGTPLCSYICTSETPVKGTLPTDTNYWSVYSQGVQGEAGQDGVNGIDGVNGTDGVDGKDGKDGCFTEFRYRAHTSHNEAPPVIRTLRTPPNWSTQPPTTDATNKYLWLSKAEINADDTLKTQWSAPVRISGIDGANGINAPILVFRGNYADETTYYGNSTRVDAVKFGSEYFVAKTNAPDGTSGFTNIKPENIATNLHWQRFGASFQSVATGLLLAENANIANLIFRNQRLESTEQTDGEPNIIIDGLTGNVKFGWLKVVGQNMVGFDDSGVERVRFTPDKLPSARATASRQSLVITAHDDTINWDVQDECEIGFSQQGWFYAGRPEDLTYEDAQTTLIAWVEFNLPEENTTVDFGDLMPYCTAKRANTNEALSMTTETTIYLQYLDGATWKNIDAVNLHRGTTKMFVSRSGRVRAMIYVEAKVDSGNQEDWYGTIGINGRSIDCYTSATKTIIAKDGIMSVFNNNYMRMHSTDGFEVKFGNYGLKIDSSGIFKTTDGENYRSL